MKQIVLTLMLCLGIGAVSVVVASPVSAAPAKCQPGPSGPGSASTTWCFNGKRANVTIRDVMIELFKFAAAGVGLAAAGGYAWGGITYGTAGGSPGQTQKGITIIANTTIGIISFFGLYGLLFFLLPENILI